MPGEEWGLLHDVKVPLTSIQLAIGEICSDPVVADRFDWQVAVVQDGLLQLREMLSTRSGTRECEAEEEITRVINILRPLAIAEGVEIETCLVRCELKVDVSALRRVIYNLLLNAIECFAVPTQGRNKKVWLTSDFRASCLQIVIKDNGPGCDQINPRKMFSIGYSSKGENRGKGLFVSKLLAEQVLGGTLKVRKSSPGLTFTLKLPVDLADNQSRE